MPNRPRDSRPVSSGARRKKKRRTQAERSAETRDKVVRAATECIAELGLSGATMARIAQRAGVSWGAMQHQFGEKDAIIDVVIERSLEEFAQQMEGLREAEPDLTRRVRAFTKRAWVIFNGPTYRAILRILLQRREKTERIATVFAGLWQEIFGDLDLTDEQQLAAQRFTFVLLSGVATESAVVPGAGNPEIHFAVLERTLLELLGGADRSARNPAAGLVRKPGGETNG